VLKFIDQWKQAKLHLLQNPLQINGDNLQDLRHKTRRTFRNKEREYLKDKSNELETNIKNKNTRELYRGIINTIKDENGNLLTDPQTILNRWKNVFNQVLNAHRAHDVRQMYMHMAKPLVPESSLVKVKIAIEKLIRYKSSGTDQIPAELIKAGAETLCSEIHRLIHSV
jgi:hypothetical protein